MLNVVTKSLISVSKEVYYVGGYVRDLVLGRDSKDIDIATDIPSDIVISVLKSAGLHPVIINKELNVVQVKYMGKEYEIARFRSESYPTGGGLRPNQVEFVDDIVHDLSRRDFTINAMAMHVDSASQQLHDTQTFVDPFGGLEDIALRTLRAVGYEDSLRNGLNRFEESPIRILRGYRFVAQLGFELDQGTKESIEKCAQLLSDTSLAPTELTGREILKTLQGQHAVDALRGMKDSGVLSTIFPELSHLSGHMMNPKFHILDAFEHTMAVLQGAVNNNEPILMRVATLLHDCAKGIYNNDYYKNKYNQHDMPQNDLDHDDRGAEVARDICLNRLHTGKQIADKVFTLVKFHMVRCALEKTSFTRFVRKVALQCTDKQDLVETLDLIVRHKGYDHLASVLRDDYTEITQLENLHAQYTKDIFIYPHELCINGKDIIKLMTSYDPRTDGKKVGELITLCLSYVSQHPERNTKTYLYEYVEKKLS